MAIFFLACFDYQERISFKSDFSGFVEYKYTVPLMGNGRNSLIRFLPVQKKLIEEKYSRKINNYSIHFSKKTISSKGFKKRALVKYRIYFSRARELKMMLLGKTTISLKDSILKIERIFPSGKLLLKKTGWIEKRIHDITLKALADHQMRFQIQVPDSLQINSNLGSLQKRGNWVLKLPLIETMKRNGEFHWNIEINKAL